MYIFPIKMNLCIDVKLNLICKWDKFNEQKD